jgi:putative transposase
MVPKVIGPKFPRNELLRLEGAAATVGRTVRFPAPLQFLIYLVASWLARQQGEAIEYLRAENRLLRSSLGPKRAAPDGRGAWPLAEKGKPLGRRRLADVASLATPETILRWYRERVAAKYDGSRARPGAGRPRSPSLRVRRLITMAPENPSWGYTRLRGALKNLGLDLGRSTIARILKENGIEPAPRRGKTLPWKTFLKAHWGAIAAADFFSVEVLTLVITCRADGEWMAQVARSLTDSVAGPLNGFVYLIVDRDPLYTAHFKSLLDSAGVKLLREAVENCRVETTGLDGGT